MPEISSIKTRVDFDTSQLSEGEVKLELFGRSVERRIEPAGQAFVRLGEHGEIAFSKISSSSAKTQADMDRLASRLRAAVTDMGEGLEKGTQAMFRLSETGEVALTKLTQSAGNTGAAFTGFASSLSEMGPAGAIAIGALVAATAALALFTAPLVAFSAGLAATLALGTGLIGFTGILGAASIALAGHAQGWFSASQNLAKAQQDLARAQEAVDQATRPSVAQLDKLKDAQVALAAATAAANNPWTVFTNRIEQAGKTLGEQTAPAAAKLLDWLTKLVDPTEQLGSRLFKWFGTELPKVLPVATRLFDDLMRGIEDLGRRLGPIFDQMAKHPETFEKAFRQTVDAAVKVIGDLVQNLRDVEHWWATDGQKMKGDAETVLTAIGWVVHATAITLDAMAWTAHNVGREFDAFGSAIDRAINKIKDLLWWLSRIPGSKHIDLSFGGGGGGGEGFTAQHGGIFPAGSWGRVGEVASELIHALPGGGVMVVPESGGGRSKPAEVHIHMEGATFTTAALARALTDDLIRELSWSWR